MNRVRLGVAILLALVCISGAVVFTVRHETNRLLEQLDSLEQTASTQPLEEAEAPFQAFEAQWEKSERILNLIVWRDRVQEIDATVAHLDPMRASDCDELLAELAEARTWIERLQFCEMPVWENIL